MISFDSENNFEELKSAAFLIVISVLGGVVLFGVAIYFIMLSIGA